MRTLFAVSALAVVLSACSGQSGAEESSPDAPAQATENAVGSLTNSQFLSNQGGDSGACYTGSRFGACAVIKNVAMQWNSAGQLEPFGFNWDGVLNPGYEDRSTSGFAHNGGDRADAVNPGPMGVGVMRIESSGAGAIGSFNLRSESTDPALQDSSFQTWIRIPSTAGTSNSTMCGFNGYVGCFIADVFGGAQVFQPNSYTGTGYKDFPCNSGLCQQISGSQGQTSNRHPQVNFTSITAPVAIEVKNNSNSALTYAGVVGSDRLLLSQQALGPAEGTTVPKGETATFYGYRSLTGDTAAIDLQFTTVDGATVTTRTSLSARDTVEARPSCEVLPGRDISKRYNCDANAPIASIKGSSATSDSPAVKVTFSIRS